MLLKKINNQFTMKNFFFTLAFLFVAPFIWAQVPQQINFQAVIRDNAGQILTDADVSLKFSILQNNVVVSEEIDMVHTSPFGIANTLIGDNSTTFTAIDWLAGALQFKVAFSKDGTNFEDIGTTQPLNSVPYALAAKNADKAKTADNVLNLTVTTNEITNGTILPEDLSPILLEKQWKQDSFGNIYRDTFSVGIGINETTPPLGTLHVQGSSGDLAAIFATANNSPYAGFFIGKMLVDGDADMHGNVEISNDANVDGKGTFNDGINVYGDNSYFSWDVTMNSNAKVNNNVNVGNSVFVGNSLVLQGNTDFSLFNNGNQLIVARGGTIYQQTGLGTNINNSRWIAPGDDDNTYLGLGNHRWKQVWCAEGDIQTSDARLKTNIERIPYGLNDLMKMNPVRYNWKKEPNGKLMTGFLAQEMEKIIPEAVVNPIDSPKIVGEKRGESEFDAYGMNYTKLIPVAVRAIQEQQAIIEQLQKQMLEMQAKIEQLEKH
jgi:hypothetical protein